MKINEWVRGKEEYDDHILNPPKSGCKEKVEKSKSLIWLYIDDFKLEPANNVNITIWNHEGLLLKKAKKVKK